VSLSEKCSQYSRDIIFVRLGCSYDDYENEYKGHETMQQYIADEPSHGYTWFSTSNRGYGMAQDKVKAFKKAIGSQNVMILFAISKKAGGTNEIEYRADVTEIESYPSKKLGPHEQPEIYRNQPERIWIKIQNIIKETKLTTSCFKITSSGNDLKRVLDTRQWSFGYISFKDEEIK
jgi:hypothetical protein